MSTQQQAQETPQQTIARLLAENEALKAKKTPAAGGLKVSAKGAVSLYGVGRFPITLYSSQWEKVLANSESIKSFILAHAAELSVKEAK